MRGGIRTNIVETEVVGLGGNEFEAGSITVTANTTIKAGAVLKRDDSGKFAPIVSLDTETPVAINPFTLTNDGSASADVALRAIVFGRVDARLLNVGGTAVTSPAHLDKIRANTNCTPVQTHDISRIR